MKSTNIANESARTRKLLAKNQALRFQPDNSASVKTSNVNPAIGEFASVCVVGPLGSTQYTICRPIGITSLEDDDWIMIPTDQVPATLARARDPRAAERSRKQAVKRLDILANAKLVNCTKTTDGGVVAFYPCDVKVPRNSHLNFARSKFKADKKLLTTELKELGKKGDGDARQEINSNLQRLNILNYMDEDVRAAEVSIRNYIDAHDVEGALDLEIPCTHTTFSGPFGDQEQVAILGAKGFPLVDVLGALNASLHKPDLSHVLGVQNAGGKSKASKSRRFRRNRKNKKPVVVD